MEASAALSEGMGERVMDDKHTPGARAAHGREAGPPLREEIIAAKRPPPEKKKQKNKKKHAHISLNIAPAFRDSQPRSQSPVGRNA